MNAGLNLLRFFLAFSVVMFHLWNAAAPGAGPVAVLGFFFTSGFLITRIVQEVYAMPARAWPFLLNRSLRIYPAYAGALAIGLGAVYCYPAVASHINSYLRWPQSVGEWLPQIAVFGLADSAVRVLPATWTLGTELYFYLLIGLGTARSKQASQGLCLLSLPVGALCALRWLPFDFYGSPVGNGFVFALGSLAYFYRDAVPIRRPVFWLAGLAYLAHVFLIPALQQTDLDAANLAGSVLPFAVVLLYLMQHEIEQPAVVRWAHVLGKMAYPMFLLHWAVCVLLSAWLFHGLAPADMHGARAGALYFAAMLAGVMACSWLFYLCIDQPLEKARRWVRRNAALLPA